MRILARYLAIAALTALAACSGGTGVGPQSQTGMLADLGAAVRADRGRPVPAPKVTRALLDRLTAPSLEVTSESVRRTAYLVPLASRSDGLPGQVRIWRTADDAQIALRAGVVTSTRGLGRDLASADVTGTIRAIRGGGGASQRVLYLRQDDGGQRAMPMTCQMADLGPETITIVERGFATRHLRETCRYNNGTAVNDYWTDSADGTIWKSRQWAGPDIGYLRLRLLRR